MANNFFTKSGVPATSAALTSSTIRGEFASIEAGFDKMPTLSGNGGKILAVNAGASALEAVTTTGTGNAVRATSPTLTTPVLGVASATSINKVAITAPATSATLTIADGKTLTVSNSITLAGTDSRTYTFPTTNATIARTDAAQTFTGTQTFTGLPLVAPAVGTTAAYLQATNTGGSALLGLDQSTGGLLAIGSSAYALVLSHNGGYALQLGTSNTIRMTIAAGGDVSMTGALAVTGAITGASVNGNAITTGTGTLTLGAGKTLTASNTLTLTGTDGSSVAFGSGGTVAYTANKLSAFAATTSLELKGVISDETGSGALVFADTPTLVTPVLGVATATSVNKVAITAPATGSTLTIADGKTLTVSETSVINHGTYTPTATAVTNVTSATPQVCQWMRVGNVVTVSGSATVTATSTGTTSLGLSLPVASALASTNQLAGAGAGAVGTEIGLDADHNFDRANLYFNSGVGGFPLGVSFTFTYLVV